MKAQRPPTCQAHAINHGLMDGSSTFVVAWRKRQVEIQSERAMDSLKNLAERERSWTGCGRNVAIARLVAEAIRVRGSR